MTIIVLIVKEEDGVDLLASYFPQTPSPGQLVIIPASTEGGNCCSCCLAHLPALDKFVPLVTKFSSAKVEAISLVGDALRCPQERRMEWQTQNSFKLNYLTI